MLLRKTRRIAVYLVLSASACSYVGCSSINHRKNTEQLRILNAEQATLEIYKLRGELYRLQHQISKLNEDMTSRDAKMQELSSAIENLNKQLAIARQGDR